MAIALAFLAASPGSTSALDKQGSAHGGALEGPERGFNVAGSAMLGVAVYNPTYTARPDNTGRALFRYAGHADVDLIGRRLSIPIDFNTFTDRTRSGGLIFIPTEADIIVGVTSTWRAGPGALEVGTRLEHDMPLDRGGLTQSYVDARARYLYSLAAVVPGIADALLDGDVTGWLTLGAFVVNPSYTARPDNTGRALLRYAFHSEISLWHQHLALGLDAILFTDRYADNPVRPSELDFTPELIGRWDRWEFHLAYERDMPIDRGGLVQHFVYVLSSVSFDAGLNRPSPPSQSLPANRARSASAERLP